MKKTLWTIALALILSVNVFAAGTTTDDPSPIKNFEQKISGVTVEITATADATTAAFLPILFDSSNNSDAYKLIIGKWLTSAKTTPAIYPAPTASYDIYIVSGVTSTSDFVLSSPTLAIGSDTSAVATAAFYFVIGAVTTPTTYYKAAVAAGTEPGNDVIAATKYGAVAFDIGANGTIDAIEATGQAAAQFATEALAIAALPACASDHVRLGFVTATKSDGAFTFGTTALNAANSTVVYRSAVPEYDIMGGRLVDRSATAAEKVYPAITSGDNEYPFIDDSLMVIFTGNSVNSAVTVLKLTLN